MTGCALAAFAVCAEVRAAEAAERPAAVETAAPRIVKAMPPDGRRDVKIHFYVDGHRRNKDANMRKDTSRAYLRALNALRLVLPDRNNPIDDGLRQRGIGKNVEVNTGTAYLLKPEGIVPVSLAKEAEAKDFGAFGKEVGAWDRDVLVRQILENEKAAENVVVCVISNDPSLSTRHGVFHLDEARGIMFFMLHAQRESVNGGIFHPYWSDEEWASFLREAMGANANDIANAIVDGYYALSADEENGLRALACAPADETISVKKIRSLPQKKLWKTTLTHNGVDVPNAEDAATLAPKSGQNKIVAQVLSPTGVSYSRTWEQDEFVYWTLGNDTRLHDQARDAAAKAKTEGMTGGKVADLNDFLQNPDKPVTKERLATLRALVAEVVAEADRLRQARETKERLERERKAKEEAARAAAAQARAAEKRRKEAELAEAKAKADEAKREAEAAKIAADEAKKEAEADRRAAEEKARAAKIAADKKAKEEADREADRRAKEKEAEAAAKAASVTNAPTPSKPIEKSNEKGGGFGFLEVLLVLLVCGGVGVVVRKLLAGKTVATVSYLKTGSTDAAVPAEAKLNKPLRLDACFECTVDVRVTPRMSEDEQLEFELTSPSTTVWLLKLGGSKKRAVSETVVAFEAGVYQMFDNELAMSPMGKVEFESTLDA